MSNRSAHIVCLVVGLLAAASPAESMREQIEANHSDGPYIEFLFNVISSFPADNRRELLRHLLKLNNSFELFKELCLMPSTATWIGSYLPTLGAKLRYLESLQPLLQDVALLDHAALLQKWIDLTKAEIASEERREFIKE